MGISHAGSLMNLAKHPASTVQILGAEKALFRALKTKKDTPKYGLIYHASMIGQAAPKFKGKISRVLAAKCALSIRVDALGDTSEATIGIEDRLKVEERLRQLEGKSSGKVNKAVNSKSKEEKEGRGRGGRGRGERGKEGQEGKEGEEGEKGVEDDGEKKKKKKKKQKVEDEE